MNNTSKNILQLLYFFFSFAMIVCYIVLAFLGLMLFSQIFGFDLSEIFKVKINIDVFGGKIQDVQTMSKPLLILTSVYGILTAFLHIKLFKTVLKIINIIKLRNSFNNDVVQLLSITVRTLLIIGGLYFFMGILYALITDNTIEISASSLQYFLFAAVIYVIEQVYRQGLDIQQENDLTI